MNLEHVRALRTPLIALAITILAAAALIAYSASVRDSARLTLAQKETELRQARLRIENAGQERDMIGRYLGTYQELARVGLVGEEHRINWLDSLRNANVQAGLFGVEYDISAQRPYAHAAEFNPGKLLLQESTMRVKLSLLHEGDLPRFLNALAMQRVGFFSIDQCVMRRLRIADSPKTMALEPYVAADCDLSWITVQPAKTEAKKTS